MNFQTDVRANIAMDAGRSNKTATGIFRTLARAICRPLFRSEVEAIRSEERAAAVRSIVDLLENTKGNIYTKTVHMGDHATVSHSVFLGASPGVIVKEAD